MESYDLILEGELTSYSLQLKIQRCDMSKPRRWNLLGMVGLECVLPHSGENSVLPVLRDFEGMSELFDWIYGDQM